uniref:Glutamate-rich 3 n=1 Tax=Poecilia formosa TaxID=48698 RepID=A0A096MBK8_POEFO
CTKSRPPRFLPAYNSLTDKHLADYFSNSRIRKHLLRAGLITRSGRIVPEKEYRHKLIQTANQNHVQECLAQAIVHKVLEREHYHQIDVKRKQVEFEKKQRVQRFKVERCKKYEEEMIRALTPCPPTTSRSIWEQLSGPLGKHFAPCDIPSLTRPSTAPGKMQRPVRLKPIHRRSSTALPRHISPYRKSLSFLESQPYNCLANFKSRRRFTTKDIYPGLDSFCLPVTKNFIIPTPPAVPPTGAPSSTIRGRRLRPSTSSSGVEYPSRLKGSIHQSRVQVTMVYFGKLVHLSDHPSVIRDEIKVLQQHCGGENLCVYQGKLREGDVFQFLSRRHRGYPFSLTFYQNGLLVERLSSCCEYKHSKGSRIGGRNGLFGFSSMEGATPCYKCIVAMGVDKLPIPPPKKVNGDLSRKLSAASLKDEPGKESDAKDELLDSAMDSTGIEIADTGVLLGNDSPSQGKYVGDSESEIKNGDVAQDDKIEDPFERNELADVEASHSDEEKVEKGSAKPDSQHDESGQRAKSREEDESSVLEPSEKVDEPEVPDIAEAEARKAETGEREAEKQSETGEIDAENGESSFAAEREPQEDEGNAVTSEEKRQTDEPDEEIESTEVKGVVTKSGDDAEKQEDSLTDQVPETGVPESDAEEAD